MKLHANAKTTPKTRQLMMDRVQRLGWTQAAAAHAASVSVRTVAKWAARHRLGLALTDASSRPHRQPRQSAPARIQAVLAFRQQRWTSHQIAAHVRMPRSTVSVILRRAGMGRLRALDPPPIIQRYEWPHAGDLLHLDIKPLGRFRAVGSRFLGAARHVR